METTSRVREILSWYPSDNPGTVATLYVLLLHGRWAGPGKLVSLPVDQGFEHGPARSFAPNPPGYDPDYHIQLAIDSGCNAYAAPLGFIEAVAGKHAGQIPLILKLNNSDTLSKGHSAESAVTGSVKDAVRLGCVAIGYTIYPGSAARNHQYENLRALAEEAKAHGLAVVTWSYPRGEGITDKKGDRKSTRLNSSHLVISYAVFCLKKKKTNDEHDRRHPCQHVPYKQDDHIDHKHNPAR